MASMDYKGYIGVISIDNDNGLLHGSVANTRDVITFEGRTVKELRKAFEESVEYYLKVCEKHHRSPEKPASGKFVVRIDPEMHRALMRSAARAEKSINTLVSEAIEARLHKEELIEA